MWYLFLFFNFIRYSSFSKIANANNSAATCLVKFSQRVDGLKLDKPLV